MEDTDASLASTIAALKHQMQQLDKDIAAKTLSRSQLAAQVCMLMGQRAAKKEDSHK
jgi:hypothetical protein